MQIQTSLKTLLAAQLFASRDESREAIQHLCFDISSRGDVIIIACDGMMMAIFHSGKVQRWPEGFEHKHTTLLAKFPEKLARNLGKTAVMDALNITWTKDDVVFQRIGGGEKISTPTTELLYPNWRQVVPIGPLRECSLSVNYDKLEKFAKASRMLTGTPQVVVYGHNSDDPHHANAYSVFFGNGAYGILMPMRADRAFEIPKWVTETPSDAPDAKPNEPETTKPALVA